MPELQDQLLTLYDYECVNEFHVHLMWKFHPWNDPFLESKVDPVTQAFIVAEDAYFEVKNAKIKPYVFRLNTDKVTKREKVLNERQRELRREEVVEKHHRGGEHQIGKVLNVQPREVSRQL